MNSGRLDNSKNRTAFGARSKSAGILPACVPLPGTPRTVHFTTYYGGDHVQIHLIHPSLIVAGSPYLPGIPRWWGNLDDHADDRLFFRNLPRRSETLHKENLMKKSKLAMKIFVSGHRGYAWEAADTYLARKLMGELTAHELATLDPRFTNKPARGDR